MFGTMDSTEIVIPSMPLTDGTHIWTSVNLNMHVHWLYVTYQAQYDDDTKLVEIIFLTEAEQLLEISLNEKIQIIEVYLVSPGYVNGSNSWKMEKVKEIWKATLRLDELDSSGRIYIVEGNCEYVHSYLTMDKGDFTKKELIFKSNNTD